MKIVFASSNQGKWREFSELLKPLNIELIQQNTLGITDADETGLSFVENAIIKARHAANIAKLPAIADDSGLAVAALNGAPGIYSARYAGTGNAEDNIQKLLSEMKDIHAENREARFHCVLVFVSHANDPTPLICDGQWSGTILEAPRGKQGFGYDPVFYVPSENCAAAELPLEIKNKISHRGMATKLLIQSLPEKLHECTLR